MTSVQAVQFFLVTHEDVVQSRPALAEEHGRALQCRFVEIVKEGSKKKGTYRIRLQFALVDTRTGGVLAQTTTEGVSTDLKSGPTAAFYLGIEKAAEAFLQSTDLTKVTVAATSR